MTPAFVNRMIQSRVLSFLSRRRWSRSRGEAAATRVTAEGSDRFPPGVHQDLLRYLCCSIKGCVVEFVLRCLFACNSERRAATSDAASGGSTSPGVRFTIVRDGFDGVPSKPRAPRGIAALWARGGKQGVGDTGSAISGIWLSCRPAQQQSEKGGIRLLLGATPKVAGA